ncbi:MAG TPA: MFS transporter [Planctomycetaceae bacterium]|jgi:MFS family permease|nr:MFS transporter [Planctomycetaceae bacterium]
MHGFEDVPPAPPEKARGPWYGEMTRYHWFVLAVAAMGWLFDTMDQQLFVLARPAAMIDLIPAVSSSDVNAAKALDLERRRAGDYATSIFIAGWATGGLFFGMLGDRIGRAKTMMITVLMYSLCTGLSSFSQTAWDFAFYRFVTGLGVGGEFAVGVALVAEVMPGAARPYALALLQALSGIGNVSAAFIFLGLGVAQEHGWLSGLAGHSAFGSPWRIMFLIGAIPAFLALLIMRRLKEPERWQRVSHEGAVATQLGSYRSLFRDPRLRKHALLGLLLGCAGVIGLWSVGFFTFDLIRFVQRKPVTIRVYHEERQLALAKGDHTRADHLDALLAAQSGPATNLPPELAEVRDELSGVVSGRLTRWSSYASIAMNIGAALGMFGFGALAQRIGRKPTFALAFLAAFFSTVAVFWFLQDFWQIWVMVPIMGFCQLSLFAGYAIYFPELFPTRLRSTGTSFCYNVGRFVAAFGPVIKAQLEGAFSHTAEPLRYAGCTMCVVFLLGLVALPFLPETKGKPLPE